MPEIQRKIESQESWEKVDLWALTPQLKQEIADIVGEKYDVELGEEDISNVEKSLEDESMTLDADNLHRNLEAVALTKSLEEELA